MHHSFIHLYDIPYKESSNFSRFPALAQVSGTHWRHLSRLFGVDASQGRADDSSIDIIIYLDISFLEL